MMSGKKRAVILLSGGLDSTTTLAIAKDEAFDAYAITFAYGQRHWGEIENAKRIACQFGVCRHIISSIDLKTIGGSALTSDIEVPRSRSLEDISHEIPITYVPARNTIFLSFALAWAETLGAADIFIGVNAMDYSGYPDCRPEFINAFEHLANLATKAGVSGEQRFKIHTPLMLLKKSEIIQKGIKLGVDYSLTRSCYEPSPDSISCGTCDACLLRLRGFQEAGLEDPIPYQSYTEVQ